MGKIRKFWTGMGIVLVVASSYFILGNPFGMIRYVSGFAFILGAFMVGVCLFEAYSGRQELTA